MSREDSGRNGVSDLAKRCFQPLSHLRLPLFWAMPKRCSRREKRKDYARERPSKWLTAFNTPCVMRPCVERTSKLSYLAGCKREHLVCVCAIAGYDIPEFDANGDLDWSIFAKVLDVKRLCSCWAVLARFLWVDAGFAGLALSLCFDAEWAGIGYCHVCTAGKLSRRAAATGREGYDCANSGDSWSHVDVIANTNCEIKS